MSDPNGRSRLAAAVGRGLNRVATRWATPGAGRVVVCSPIVGLISGLGAVVFLLALDGACRLVLGGVLHFNPPPTGEGVRHAVTYPWPWWLVPLLPALGGLISGWIVYTFAPEAAGGGIDALIRAFHHEAGQVRARVPFVKGVSSVVTIASGGSAGQEGPIAQIGAGFGSYVARLLRLTPTERRLLMLAGVSGGIGAIFRAPLGAALFAGEMLYATTATESAALLPCLASSIVAYSTFALFITPRPMFVVPPVRFHGFAELPLFLVLGLVCTGVGWLFVKVMHGLRSHVFNPLPVPRHVKPAIGGLAVGLLALAVPEVMSGGYGWVQWGAFGLPPDLAMPGEPVFTPHLGWRFLLLLALMKCLATGLTIGSGGSGGTLGPSVFIGGMLGGAVGQLFAAVVPGNHVEPAAFALVGMGGFFAGVTKTPLASILMVCEITGSYSLLVPLMLVCSLHMVLSRPWGLDEEQVPSPVDSPAHLGDFVIDVLERVRVADVLVRTEGVERVPESTTFDRVIRLVANSPETLYPVVDTEGRLTGIFSLRDVRLALAGTNLGSLVLAADLATRPVLTVTPRDDLHTALKRLTERNLDEIPVVAPDDPTRLLGLLSRRELVGAYSAQIDALRARDGVPPV